MTSQSEQRSAMIIRTAFARFDVRALVVATGLVMGLVVFLATIVLVLRGNDSGEPVGTHLQLLSNYFPGYSVTWLGSSIGAFYGFFVGAATGFIFGFGWNLSHVVFLMVSLIERRQGADL